MSSFFPFLFLPSNFYITNNNNNMTEKIMNGNLNTILLLAMMMVFIMPGIVLVQTREAFAPSVHNHPPHSQLPSHILSSFPPFYISKSPSHRLPTSS